jgi:hypothetical protein
MPISELIGSICSHRDRKACLLALFNERLRGLH